MMLPFTILAWCLAAISLLGTGMLLFSAAIVVRDRIEDRWATREITRQKHRIDCLSALGTAFRSNGKGDKAHFILWALIDQAGGRAYITESDFDEAPEKYVAFTTDEKTGAIVLQSFKQKRRCNPDLCSCRGES